MPTVPRITNTELLTKALPSQKQGTTPDLAAFGGGSAVTEAFKAGRELIDTGVDINVMEQKRRAAAENEFLKFQAEEKKKADEVLVRDADLGMSEDETRIGIDMKNMKGREAAGTVDYVDSEWKKSTQRAMAQAVNDEQKDAIQKISAQRYASLNKAAQEHTYTALKEHDEEMSETLIDTTKEQSSLNYDKPDLVARNFYVMAEERRKEGLRQGKDKTVVDADIAKDRSQTHAAIMERMIVDGKDDLAKAYGEKWNKEIQQDELKYLEAVRKTTKESRTEVYENLERTLFLGTLPDSIRPPNVSKVGLDEALTLLSKDVIKLSTYNMLKSQILNVYDDPTIPVEEKVKKQWEINDMFQDLGGEVSVQGMPTTTLEPGTYEKIKALREKVIESKRYLPKEFQESILRNSERALIKSNPEKMGLFKSLVDSLKNIMGSVSPSSVLYLTQGLQIFNKGVSVQQAVEKVTELKQKAAITANPNLTRYKTGQILPKGTTVQYKGKPVILPESGVIKSIDEETGSIDFE